MLEMAWVLYLAVLTVLVSSVTGCEQLTIPICLQLNYTSVRFPNEIGHTEQESAKIEIRQLDKLITSGCSSDVHLFLCSLYAPYCDATGVEIRPCRETCINVRDRCEPYLLSLGYEWPNTWKCGRFQVEEDQPRCVKGVEKPVTEPHFDYTTQPPPAVTTLRVTEKPEEGETDVFPVDNSQNVCRSDQLYCDDQCVPLQWRCDKFSDCHDGMDETDCDKCLSNQFKCADRSQCIPLTSKCDTFADCSDGSDEENCNTCSGGEFECDRKRCIPQSFRCDSKHDCTDGTDEQDCGECLVGQFKCANNRCIDASQECDNSDDCGDGSDEISCYNVGPDPEDEQEEDEDAENDSEENSNLTPCSTVQMNCNMNSECKREMDNYRRVCERQMASPDMITCSKACYNAYYQLLSKKPYGEELIDRKCDELYVSHVQLSCIRQPATMDCINALNNCKKNTMCEGMYRRYSKSCVDVLTQHDPCSDLCVANYQTLIESPLSEEIRSNCIEVNTTIPTRCGPFTGKSTGSGAPRGASSTKLYSLAVSLSMLFVLFTRR